MLRNLSAKKITEHQAQRNQEYTKRLLDSWQRFAEKYPELAKTMVG